MPRPKTNEELLHQGTINFEKLFDFIESFSEQENEFPKGTMNRNIRDVHCHLHHWHLLMREWYTIGMKGEKLIMPAMGFTWKTTPDLNKWIWESYQDSSLEESKYWVKKGFLNLRNIIDSHSDEELFRKKKHKWTGTTSMGSYFVSATLSHYDWYIN